ncbi:alpha/beta fold hydrolase [Nocardioides pakistanensis]
MDTVVQVTHSWSSVFVDGRRVEVARVETPAAPERDPWVFLHGWGLSPRSYLPGLRALAARTGREVLALSLPGFGRSAPLPLRQQGVAGIAAHLAGALDALGLDHVDVIGHSFGGGIALRLGTLRPGMVSSITAISPVGGAGTGAVPVHRMLGGLTLDGLHRWTPRAVADLVPNIRRHPAAFLGSAVAAWRADLLHDLYLLSRTGVRTAVAFAERDAVVTPGAIPHNLLRGIRVETVPGRHSWLLTEPHRFAEHVTSRLWTAPATSATTSAATPGSHLAAAA